MIELTILNREGKPVGTVQVDEADFGGTVRPRLLREVVLMYEAAQRAGTHSTLVRSEARGSRAKPWRQKGTGRARAGFRRSPLWRGGAVVFGPRPRSYRYAIPRKAVRAATRSAYLAKFQDGETLVVDGLEAERPCTREMAATLATLGVQRGCLIAIERHDINLWKSARNIPGVSMKTVGEINAYDLLRHRQLLITRPALERLVATLRAAARKPATHRQAADQQATGRPATEQPATAQQATEQAVAGTAPTAGQEE